MFLLHLVLLYYLVVSIVVLANQQQDIKENKFDFQRLKSRAQRWDTNGVSKENIAIMLSVFGKINIDLSSHSSHSSHPSHPSPSFPQTTISTTDELYYRREILRTNNKNTSVPVSLAIGSGAILHERLELAEAKHGRKCHNKNRDILLFSCLITKNDGIDLQEWLVWQIVVVGVNHVLVYLNDPEADNTWSVLQPFIEQGYVTAFNKTARGYQKRVYNECIDFIRQKACYYSGTGPLPTGKCPPGMKRGDIDGYYGSPIPSYTVSPQYKRQVWVAGFDSDEFALDFPRYQCFSDILSNYTAYNGLMLPWARFGHNQVFTDTTKAYTDKDKKLVTESYMERRPDCKPHFFGKAFNRVSRIDTMDNGHVAVFAGKVLAVNETVPVYAPPTPSHPSHHPLYPSIPLFLYPSIPL